MIVVVTNRQHKIALLREKIEGMAPHSGAAHLVYLELKQLLHKELKAGVRAARKGKK